MTPVMQVAERYVARLVREGWDRQTAERYARRRYGMGCFHA
jgi:hypothetical protein